MKIRPCNFEKGHIMERETVKREKNRIQKGPGGHRFCVGVPKSRARCAGLMVHSNERTTKHSTGHMERGGMASFSWRPRFLVRNDFGFLSSFGSMLFFNSPCLMSSST